MADLAPLAGLTELRRLDLTGNRIDELWPLGGLPKLEMLLLDGNRLADIGTLDQAAQDAPGRRLGRQGENLGRCSPWRDAQQASVGGEADLL